MYTKMREDQFSGHFPKASICDPRFVPLPFRAKNQGQKLTFGWYDLDGVFEATPGCRRAVQTAILALEKNGHQVVPFCPPHLPTAMKVNTLYRAGDLGATNKTQLSIGPVSTQSLGLRRLQHRLPAPLRIALATGMLGLILQLLIYAACLPEPFSGLRLQLHFKLH